MITQNHWCFLFFRSAIQCSYVPIDIDKRYDVIEGRNQFDQSFRSVALLIVRKFEQVSYRFGDTSIKFEFAGSRPPSLKISLDDRDARYQSVRFDYFI